MIMMTKIFLTELIRQSNTTYQHRSQYELSWARFQHWLLLFQAEQYQTVQINFAFCTISIFSTASISENASGFGRTMYKIIGVGVARWDGGVQVPQQRVRISGKFGQFASFRYCSYTYYAYKYATFRRINIFCRGLYPFLEKMLRFS